MSFETNPLRDPSSYHKEEITESVEWTAPRLGRIVRLRLLSDPGFPLWDVSYCHGILKDGSKVSVELPFDQLRKGGRGSVSKQIIAYAKKDGVYAKGLGVLTAVSSLN